MKKPRLVYRSSGQWFWRLDYYETSGFIRRFLVGPYPDFETCAKVALR